MIATLFLEMVNNDKYSWLNHTISKEEEVDWLLAEAKKVLMKAFVDGVGKDKIEGKIDMPKGKRF